MSTNPQAPDMTAAEIARELSPAQRKFVLGEYNPNLTGGGLSKIWRNLRKRGLSDQPYAGLNDLGLAVRAELEKSHG